MVEAMRVVVGTRTTAVVVPSVSSSSSSTGVSGVSGVSVGAAAVVVLGATELALEDEMVVAAGTETVEVMDGMVISTPAALQISDPTWAPSVLIC
jgi:hypothetical protein